MLSIIDLFEDSSNLGGVVARTATTVAVPIPGAGIILSPVASVYGETLGSVLPTPKKLPNMMKDSVEIYKSGGDQNMSFSPTDQVRMRKAYVNKAQQLGYNKVGQTIAAIDPGLLSITPNLISKNKKINNEVI
jgi:hypothetical protein